MGSFSLIVLRPLRHAHELHYSDSTPISMLEATSHNFHFVQDYLYEPIFSWSPDIDMWSGLSDEENRTYSKNLFLSSFNAGLPPGDRSFLKLKEVVGELRITLKEANTNSWLPTGQMNVDSDGEEFSVCISPNIAFLNYLDWLIETFQHVPDLVLITR